MKKLFLLLMSISLLAFVSDKKEHIAEVEMVSGIPIFVFSKPVAEYEIVGKALSFKEIVSLMVDQDPTTKEKVEQIVLLALQRVEKGKIPQFDALIFELDNDKVHAIKFKTDISQEARIDNYSGGIPVYFFSEPTEEYEVLIKLDADYSIRAQRSGILFDKIQSMVNRTIRKEEDNEIEPFDGIIINPEDLSETLIVFEK